MSQVVAAPSLRDYVSRLSPAQEQHLRLIISQDAELPDLDPYGDIEEDEVPADLLALIGSVKGAPPD